MSTPDAENAPLLRTKRSERSSVLSFAKTSGASRLDVFLLCTRVCTTPPWRHPAPRTPVSTIPAPPLDDRDADRTPPSSFLPQPPSSRSSPSPPTPATPSRCARATPRTVPPIRARKTKPPHAGAIRAPRRAAPRSRPRPRAHPDVSPRPSPPPSRGKRRRLTQRNSPNSSHPIPPQPTYPPLFIFAGAPRFRLRLRARRRG